MPYKAGFNDWVLDTFDQAVPHQNLFKHQTFVKEFMKDDSPYRGLLLFHGLGVGKTRSAIEIAKANKKDVIVLLPASLKENFLAEIKKCNASVSRFTFASYNGINKKNIGKYLEEGFFDNKLIIIDEVHNFISRVSGNSLLGKQLYQKLMEAKDSKIVALSGTPMINKPLELAFLLNLIHGYIYTTIYKYTGYTDFKRLEASIAQQSNISTCYIDTEANAISISEVIPGFMKDEDGFITKSNGLSPSSSVRSIIKDAGLVLKKETLVKNTLFPFKEEHWDDLFVDYSNVSVMNDILFSRRIQGLVSYYEAYNNNDYPEQIPLKIVDCPMSKTHFGKYLVVRQEEISKEQKAARFRKKEVASEKDEIKNGNVYRSFSRAVCNFAFPNAIKRPYPSTLREFKYDVECDWEDEGNIEKEEVGKGDNKRLYDKKVAEALDQLEKSGVLSTWSGLEEHSSKMKAILENIGRSAGTALVYSMFRNVEGLNILALALQQLAGYVQLTVKKGSNGWKLVCSDFSKPKYIIFTDNREETELLLALYNSDFDKLPLTVREQLVDKTNLHGEFVKVLMITQSGSEGISLKNVRQVHILEPYWNNIRLQQVMGRAIRAMSHLALPKAERKVETFLYITTLSEEQKEHSLIKAHDNGFTSDGYVYNIAKKKAIINDKFLQLLKNASVDCKINKKAHGSRVQCFKAPHTKSGMVFYMGDCSKDVPDKAIKMVVKNVRDYKSLKILFDGNELVILAKPTDKELRDFQDLANDTFKLQLQDTDLSWQGIFFRGNPTRIVGLMKGKAIKWIEQPSSIVKMKT